MRRFAGRELYGGSGFREKTLRWEIATAGCRSREIGDMPWEGMREREDANRTRESRRSAANRRPGNKIDELAGA